MHIGGFFIITLVMSVYAMTKNNGFIEMAIFFAAFCESCVIYTRGFFLSPGHFFVFLALAIVLIRILYFSEIRFVSLNNWLTAFVIIASVSIVVSWVFRVDVQVFGVGTGHGMKSSLVSMQNITQFIYIAVGYLFCLMLVNYSYKYNKWNECVRTVMIASLFILLIGVYQFIANSYNLPFETIFKNPYKVQWQTRLRAQSVMGEASFLGQYCAYLCAIFFAPDYERPRSRMLSILYVALLIYISIMTQSSTLIFGVLAVVLTYALIERKTYVNALKWLIIIVAGIIIFLVLLQTNSQIQHFINTTADKLSMQNHSGIERSEIFAYMTEVGLKYPVLGIGYGGGRSRDLYSNLFSNTGFIGLAVFLAFIIKDAIILIRNIESEGSRMCLCILAVFLVTSFSIPDISYLTFWMFIGLVEAKCIELTHGTNNACKALYTEGYDYS